MNKDYEFRIDVTLTGSIYIEAKSEAEARKIFKSQYNNSWDIYQEIKSMCHTSDFDVFEVNEFEI